MLLQAKRAGFTLIELLVVITIIGILATGATTVYTSQIQKARDTTRIKDIDAMKVAAEQVYQDSAEYPHTDTFVYGGGGVTGMNTYMKQLPKDAKHAQTCNNAGSGDVECAYAYHVTQDANGIDYGAYEFSTAFESEGNVTKKAAGDVGADNLRYETGVELNSIDSTVGAGDITTEEDGACTVGGAVAAANGVTVVINGNPTANTSSCN